MIEFVLTYFTVTSMTNMVTVGFAGSIEAQKNFLQCFVRIEGLDCMTYMYNQPVNRGLSVVRRLCKEDVAR